MICPKCNKEMDQGYSVATASISWVAKEKFDSYAFFDEDLSNARWKKFFPAKAEYFKSYRCKECECILIDHSTKSTRAAVEKEISDSHA